MAGNTGTKQIRVGRVHRFIDDLETTRKQFEAVRAALLERDGGESASTEIVGAKLDILSNVIEEMRAEFNYGN